MYSTIEEDVKFCFGEILKVKVFSRPFLERNYVHRSISIENILFSWTCDIKTTKCKKCDVTDASKFITKNSNMLEIEQSLFNSPYIIPRDGFHLRSNDLADKAQIHRIPGQFVNKSSVIKPS